MALASPGVDQEMSFSASSPHGPNVALLPARPQTPGPAAGVGDGGRLTMGLNGKLTGRVYFESEEQFFYI